MKLHLRHELPCTPAAFWEAFFDPATAERMYRQALGATAFDVREQAGDIEAGLTRVLYSEQPIDAPGPVKKLMGTSAGSTERGAWDPAGGTWTFTLEPSKMGDKITITGIVKVEPDDSGCARVFDLDAAVRIFGIGKVFEGFIERQTRDAQDATAAWLRTALA